VADSMKTKMADISPQKYEHTKKMQTGFSPGPKGLIESLGDGPFAFAPVGVLVSAASFPVQAFFRPRLIALEFEGSRSSSTAPGNGGIVLLLKCGLRCFALDNDETLLAVVREG